MTIYNVFPSVIYKARIDPESYDKKSIIEKAMVNYSVEPNKNVWDDASELHHYYGQMFEAPREVRTLEKCYAKIIDDYIKSIKTNHNELKYQWKIVNFAVNTKYMAPHDHYYQSKGWQSAFSACHYISYYWRDHSPTKFLNPLVFGQYGYNIGGISGALDRSDIHNSTYFADYSPHIKEDDIIIFPSYLKHVVNNGIKQETDKPRILGVANIDIKIGD